MIFAHHCTNLCRLIRELINTGDLDELLSSSPAILKDLDRVEQEMHPLSDKEPITSIVIEPPSMPYTIPARISIRDMGILVYQATFRMSLSYDISEFLLHASRAPRCTPQQRKLFTQIQQRNIEEFRAIASKVLMIMAVSFGISSLNPPDQPTSSKDDLTFSCMVGWSDTIRILWPLRMITECSISLKWQKDTANKICNYVNRQLGII